MPTHNFWITIQQNWGHKTKNWLIQPSSIHRWSKKKLWLVFRGDLWSRDLSVKTIYCLKFNHSSGSCMQALGVGRTETCRDFRINRPLARLWECSQSGGQNKRKCRFCKKILLFCTPDWLHSHRRATGLYMRQKGYIEIMAFWEPLFQKP